LPIPVCPTRSPCGTAYPHAQAIVEAGVEAIYQVLRAQQPPRYGRPTARKLVTLAKLSVRSGRALAGRATSLQILCDQLDHTRANLARLESDLGRLIASDPAGKGLSQVQEFGLKTVAVLRAKLGDVARFRRTDQAIAYGGLDIEIKESGLWKGKAKLSKRGSGLLRRVLAPFCFA
jgi:transposase